MSFWDEKKGRVVKNCSGCSAIFIKGKGANCLLTCEARKLEVKHKEVVLKMISHCLPKIKVIVEFPKKLSAKSIFRKNKGWGWTNDIKQIITIPWYTLRSKKEFFETNPHEIGHITAFKKKFTSTERKALKTSVELWGRYKVSKNVSLFKKLEEHDKKNQKTIDKYLEWEDGHDYNPWYQEYLKFHKKLVNSSFVEYAYGDTKPRSYGFDKHGKGEYKPKIIKK